MKVLLMFFALLALVTLLLFVLTIPTVGQLSDCISQYNLKIEENMAVAKQQRWNKQKVCVEGQPAVLELSDCYSSVEQKNIVPLDIVYTIARVIKPNLKVVSSKDAIGLHNSACSAYPETLVGQ
jgi:hypothetical protein